MGKTRWLFDASFKLKLIRVIKDLGLSIAQACKDMQLGEIALRRWVL